MKRLFLLYTLLCLLIPSLALGQVFLKERKRNATIYQLPDGKLRAKVTAHQQNYLKNGVWNPINTNIESEVITDYTHKVSKVDYLWRFNKNGSVNKVDYAGKYVIFRPQNAQTPLLTTFLANRVYYRNLWTQTTVVQIARETGVKERIIMRNRFAPNQFRFRVETDDSVSFADGELTFNYSNLIVRKPFCVGFPIVQVSGEDTTFTTYPVTTTFDGTYYTMTVDTTGANFPLVLDPTTIIKPYPHEGKDTWLNTAQADKNYGVYITLQVGEAEAVTITRRALLYVDISELIPSVATITSAECSLIVADESAANGGYLHAHRLIKGFQEGTGNDTASNDGSTWNKRIDAGTDTTWNTAGAWDLNMVDIDSTSWGKVSFTATEVEGAVKVLTITNLVQNWFDGTYDNFGILLKTDGEVDDLIHYYSSDSDSTLKRPSLSITYTMPTSGTITIKPSTYGRDAYIRNDYTTRNYGANTAIATGEYNAGAIIWRSLIYFVGVSAISSTATVTSAVCSLVIVDDLATNGGTVHAHRVAVDWYENNLNDAAGHMSWNNRNPTTAWTTAGAWGTHAEIDTVSRGSFAFTGSDTGSKTFNITALVQGWVDGTWSNYGILLKSDGESEDAYTYHSSESTTATSRPSLTITYEGASTSNVTSLDGTLKANVKLRNNTLNANIKSLDGTVW